MPSFGRAPPVHGQERRFGRRPNRYRATGGAAPQVENDQLSANGFAP